MFLYLQHPNMRLHPKEIQNQKFLAAFSAKLRNWNSEMEVPSPLCTLHYIKLWTTYYENIASLIYWMRRWLLLYGCSLCLYYVYIRYFVIPTIKPISQFIRNVLLHHLGILFPRRNNIRLRWQKHHVQRVKGMSIWMRILRRTVMKRTSQRSKLDSKKYSNR